MPSTLPDDGCLPDFDADETSFSGSPIESCSDSALVRVELVRLAGFRTGKFIFSLIVVDDFLDSIKDGSSSTMSPSSLPSPELVKFKSVLGLSSHVSALIGLLWLGLFRGLSVLIRLSASRFSSLSFLTLMTSNFNASRFRRDSHDESLLIDSACLFCCIGDSVSFWD